MNLFGFFMHGGDEIDLAPLVDIAFLLLTFFIMTATFVSQEIELKPELPESSSDKKEPDARYITVVIGDSAKGEDKLVLFMDNASVREKAFEGFVENREEVLSLKGLEVKRDQDGKWKKKLLQILLRARTVDSGQTIVLKADNASNYGIIHDAMMVMRAVNFDQVQVVTELEK